MANYRPARDYRNQATIYGTLPDHGQDPVALVLHTTETKGMPGFGGGDTAPHYVYRPQDRTWDMWAEYEDGYCGTLKGHTTAGHGNCKAFQVEMLCYSNKSAADSVGGIWIGDFTDENYADLARFFAWARYRYGIELTVTPTPDGGWKYGTGSVLRMSSAEWAEFGGLTAHGAVPGNTHWDTGVLDLQRVHDMSVGLCPWADDTDYQERDDSYPGCNQHFFWDGSALPQGIGKNQHQGQCNVPNNQHEGISWAFEDRLYIEGNQYRYDYDTILTEGRATIILGYRRR